MEQGVLILSSVYCLGIAFCWSASMATLVWATPGLGFVRKARLGLWLGRTPSGGGRTRLGRLDTGAEISTDEGYLSNLEGQNDVST